MTLAALALPLAVMGAGIAGDRLHYNRAEQRITGVADAAAKAGVREMVVARAAPHTVRVTVEKIIETRMAQHLADTGYTSAVRVDPADGYVMVEVSASVSGLFGARFLPGEGVIKVEVTAATRPD